MMEAKLPNSHHPTIYSPSSWRNDEEVMKSLVQLKESGKKAFMVTGFAPDNLQDIVESFNNSNSSFQLDISLLDNTSRIFALKPTDYSDKGTFKVLLWTTTSLDEAALVDKTLSVEVAISDELKEKYSDYNILDKIRIQYDPLGGIPGFQVGFLMGLHSSTKFLIGTELESSLQPQIRKYVKDASVNVMIRYSGALISGRRVPTFVVHVDNYPAFRALKSINSKKSPLSYDNCICWFGSKVEVARQMANAQINKDSNIAKRKVMVWNLPKDTSSQVLTSALEDMGLKEETFTCGTALSRNGSSWFGWIIFSDIENCDSFWRLASAGLWIHSVRCPIAPAQLPSGSPIRSKKIRPEVSYASVVGKNLDSSEVVQNFPSSTLQSLDEIKGLVQENSLYLKSAEAERAELRQEVLQIKTKTTSICQTLVDLVQLLKCLRDILQTLTDLSSEADEDSIKESSSTGTSGRARSRGRPPKRMNEDDLNQKKLAFKRLNAMIDNAEKVMANVSSHIVEDSNMNDDG